MHDHSEWEFAEGVEHEGSSITERAQVGPPSLIIAHLVSFIPSARDMTH